MKHRLLLLLLLSSLVTMGLARQQKSYSASRFDVAVVASEGGALQVTETVVFDFVGGPFTFVFRELPTDHTDGIVDISASADGRPFAPGTAPGQVEIEQGNPIRITWHFLPTSDSRHTFVLSYRVLGVVRQAEGADLLAWQALPDNYAYTIASSLVTISYPPGVALAAGPEVEAGQATVQQGDNRVAFQAGPLAANAPLVVSLRFAPGSLIQEAPAWQARQQRQGELAPLWMLLAGLVAASGLFGFVYLWQQQRHDLPAIHPRFYAPPEQLPPALAGVLTQRAAQPTWANALGTLFDLARRGVLSIDEPEEKRWLGGRDFRLSLHEVPASLQPHEQALLDLVFRREEGMEPEVKLSELRRRLSSRRWGAYKKVVAQELAEAGWLDERRKASRRRVLIAGTLLSLFGGLLFVVAALWLPLFGPWPFAVAAAIDLAGVAGIISGVSHSTLTREGAAQAEKWRAYGHYLRQVTRRQAAVTRPDAFELFLPYAATFGLLAPWARFFKKQPGTVIPPWFHALARADGEAMNSFVAMADSASSSGGSASGGAGAAGAGAAGGGSSGAG